ncbi:MAG: HNH endonuclease signature motif containing protein [Beijerinckiaceae bacterium]|nr:HNH endonuclease signature motif containing protein [Beijerinckiaceae bacterium]
MVISDYHAAFRAAFDRPDVAAMNLHGLRKRLGWKVGRDPGRYIGMNSIYSSAERDWIRDNCTMTITERHAAFCDRFARSDITAGQIEAFRKRNGWKTGRTGRIVKGCTPPNKGKKMPFNAASAATQFKKGQLPANAKWAGHERVNVDGYVEISICEINPHTGFERRYVHKHRLLWELAHGPIPDGMVLKCRGERSNSDPSNWELIPMGVLPRLNGKSGRAYDAAPEELKPIIMTVAKLEHRVRTKLKA